jgi:hypothetical protein
VLKKIWKDPVWSVVIATGIIAAFAAVSNYFLGWWTGVIAQLKKSWHFMQYTTPLPNWLIGILIFGAIAAISILLIKFKATPSKAITPKSYKDDIFFDIHWRWICDSFGGIHDLSSFCQICDYQIYPRNIVGYAAAGDHIVYICEECQKTIHDFDVGLSVAAIEDRVIRLIQKNLRNIKGE